MKKLFFIVITAGSISVYGQKKQFINPPELIKPSGYSHVVVVTAKKIKTVYIAGQIPFDSKGELIGKEDFKAQVIQTYENIKIALKAAGATFDNVVKMNTFIANYNPEYLKMVREVRINYLSGETPPAGTTVGVIMSPGVLVEIEALAIIK